MSVSPFTSLVAIFGMATSFVGRCLSVHLQVWWFVFLWSFSWHTCRIDSYACGPSSGILVGLTPLLDPVKTGFFSVQTFCLMSAASCGCQAVCRQSGCPFVCQQDYTALSQLLLFLLYHRTLTKFALSLIFVHLLLPLSMHC